MRIEINRGFGWSLGNMLEVLSGAASTKIHENWIEVEEVEPGVFHVTNDNMTNEDGNWIVDNTALGFSGWSEEVVDLDAGWSDEAQCFGMSSHLRWQDVDLRPYKFRAASIERLKQALEHVQICAWCPGDI